MVGGRTELMSAPPVAPAAQHRPQLDGVRAVAVYLVVLYHAGLGALEGGFVGVDVFFVLSGYLVTQLLLRDLATHGRIRLRRFYARRYRRLLPAAFVVLMVTAAVLTVVAAAADVANARGGFQASFLYVANWHFIQQAADYFAADVESNPVLHFWSLAVEEQFYLLWPLLLGGLHLVVRRAGARQPWIRAAVLAGAVASAGAALHVGSSDLARAYYGTDTRAYQLLAGAVVALTPSLVGRVAASSVAARGLAVAALAATVVLATSLVDLDAIERGVGVALATTALIVAIEGPTAGGTVVRALSHRFVAYLGRISYGTYLWHWPLIVLLGYEVELSPVALAALACAGSTALAAASFHLLEHPVRRSRALDLRPRLVIGAGLALSVVSGVALAPAVLDTKESGPIEVDWRAAERDRPPLPECTSEAPEGCTVVHGSGRHVLLLGDSNARMLIPTFTEIAQRDDLSLSIAAAPLCPWIRGVFFLRGGDTCQKLKQFWFDELIGRIDPDVIVLALRPMDDPAFPVGFFSPDGRFDFGDPGYDAALADGARRTIATLRADGRRVVVVEPVPIAAKEDDPLICLSSAEDLADCEYRANAEPTPLELALRDVADGAGTWTLDLDRLVCPRLPACDPVVDDLVVKRDSNHLTGTFAAHLADAVADLLEDDAVLR
jgi:peptidoglycan/LPS O-acetylase OafA/YrhL